MGLRYSQRWPYTEALAWEMEMASVEPRETVPRPGLRSGPNRPNGSKPEVELDSRKKKKPVVPRPSQDSSDLAGTTCAPPPRPPPRSSRAIWVQSIIDSTCLPSTDLQRRQGRRRKDKPAKSVPPSSQRTPSDVQKE